MSNLAEAVQLIRMGNREEGRQILEEILEADENDEEVWLWLSAVVDSDEDREICLENVLALNPDNAIAQKGIAMVRAGRYNANEILGDLLEEEEEGLAPTTFIDDFSMGTQFEDDDELVMPGSMKTASTATSKVAKKKKGKGGGLNLRLIILAGLGLLVILVLAGVAAVSLLGGGSEEGTPVENPQAQETPAGGEAPAPAPTDTPTPAPTDTPTLTPTPGLQLPTPRPTDLPTPTATTVVSPTPSR